MQRSPKWLCGLFLGLIALQGATNSEAAVLPETTKLGGFNAAGFGGAYGFIFGPISAGNPNRGLFGAAWAGPSLIDSVTLTQYVDTNRHRPKDVQVWYSPSQFINATFVDTQSTQTLDFRPLYGGQPLQASPFIMIRVLNEYTAGSGDLNFGVMSYSFDGVQNYPNEVNLNAGATATSTNGLGGFDVPAKAVDGTIVSHNLADATYWARNVSGPDSLTVTYGSAQNIGKIGLGFAADNGGRDLPKFVTITNSNGESENITIDPLQSQYQRYLLTRVGYATTSLTITFPSDITSASWYINGDSNYGLTEFQAFVPEPVSMGFLAIGGMMLLNRRRHAAR